LVQDNDASAVEAAVVDVQSTPISRCGSVRLEFRYDARRKRLAVVVREATDLPDQDRGGSELTEVHLVLLPAKRTRHKTHAKPGSNPTFDDNFHFRVPPGMVACGGVRLTEYIRFRIRSETGSGFGETCPMTSPLFVYRGMRCLHRSFFQVNWKLVSL